MNQKFINFNQKIKIDSPESRYRIKTLETEVELREAFRLRYKVFQVEKIGLPNEDNEDFDEYDLNADHLGIFDTKANLLIGTCRLNSSEFCKSFYSEQEFNIASLIAEPVAKLEIGRVCIHQEYRKGIIIMLLWRAIAKYIQLSDSKIVFGCGSVSTEDPKEAALLYKYLFEESRMQADPKIFPTEAYGSNAFQSAFSSFQPVLTADERELAKSLLPSLCRSYFDIGCYVPCAPAFDRDFKCIDFLTVLRVDQLNPQLKKKLFGD